MPSPRPTQIAGISLLLILLQSVAWAQVADFTADVTAGCFPLAVKFTDTSTGSPTGWSWDFGNGNSSPLQNPSAIFSAPGTYTVALTASKSGSSNTKTKTGFIKVHGPPDVDFSLDVTSGCAPLSVNFDDNTSASSGTLTNWFWVFGDGGTSQSSNPTYVFQQPGQKTISLKVRNQHGCERTKVVETAVNVRGPVTDFTPSSSAICTLPATFTFTNATTGQAPLSFEWNFGNGQTSTETNPSHTYTTAGGHDIVLKATDQSGCSFSRVRRVYAGSDGGIDFSTTPDPVCPGQAITFASASVDPVASYEWTFGNGKTSTGISPTTTYDIGGSYVVTLKAQLLNHACMSVVTKSIEIAAPAVPIIVKSPDCNLNLLLSSNSINATRVEWYINDVLVSKSPKTISPLHLPGNQTVRLVAYNSAGCAYEKKEEVTLMTTPVARFKPNKLYSCKPEEVELAGCAPFIVNFVNGSTAGAGTSWLWVFGDGSISNEKDPSHTYNATGVFTVKLTASNGNGCSTTASTTVKVSKMPPVGNFEVDKILACPGETITFTDKSLNAESWCWNFGDGWILDGKTVQHGYALAGTYTVTLTAKNGCNTVITKTNLITIKNPNVTFSYNKTCEEPFKVNLTNLSTNYDDLHWDFGDGQTSTLYDPGPHQYATEGNYELKLIGTNNSTGCTTIAVAPLTIQQVSAEFSVAKDKVCVGMPLEITEQSHAAVKWNWSLGPHTSKQRNFGATLFTPGDYVASLEVKDSDSCVAFKTIPIQVINMKGDFSFTATSTCDEFAVQFKDESTGTPTPTSWMWQFGDGQTSTEQNPLHAYTSQGTHDVILQVSNAEGSCAFAKEDAVDFRIPVPDFAIAKPAFCVGETVTLANTTANGSQYKWFFGDGRSSELQSPSVSFPAPRAYTITLVTTDQFGCEQRIIKPDFINVVQPVADFSVDKAVGSCPPFTATFQDKSTANINSWQWAFGDGKTSNVQHPVNIYSTAGAFNVMLTVTDVNHCTASKSVPQFVTVGGPSGEFTATGWGTCTSQEVTFRATVLNAARMTWDFGDGVVMDRMTTTFTHEYNSTGTFTPSLLLTDANGCKVIAFGSGEITIRDTTAITTTVDPSCVFEGDPLQLTGETETDDLLLWSWTIDGVGVGESDRVETSIDKPGLHVVKGSALNESGCVTSVTTDVHVQGSLGEVPNVFTPNGDSKNQTFIFEGLQTSEWNFSVSDRWGKQVYEEENYQGNWDGGNLPAGVYYFVLKNALCEGADYKGVVSVVR